MEIMEEILEEYRRHYKIEAESYRMMGKLLDQEWVNERLILFQIFNMYVYGGTFLAAQLCHVVKDCVNVKGIVDKGGRCAIKMDIPIYVLDEFKKIYLDEKVIITLPGYNREIKADLSSFIPEENIIFLGDFLEGLF
jgi:hypothetical protein